MANKVIERVQGTTIDWVVGYPSSLTAYTSDWQSPTIYDDTVDDVNGWAATLTTDTGITHRSGNPPTKPNHP